MTNIELLKAIQIDAGDNRHTELTIQGDGQYTEWALEYSRSYDGSFPFMLDIQAQIRDNKSLSPKQIAAVLNCALKEAKTMDSNSEQEKKVFTLDLSKNSDTPVVSETATPVKSNSELGVAEHKIVQAVNNPNVTIHKVVNRKTGETFIVEGQEYSSEGVVDIEKKMADIEAAIKNVEDNDTLNTLATVVNELQAEEDAIFVEMQQKIDRIRADRLARKAELKATEANIKELRLELSRLATEKEKRVDVEEQQKKLDELADRLSILILDSTWDSIIHDYQRDDVYYTVAAFLDGRNGVLNANEMGLGKTFESVAVLWLLSECGLFEEKYGHKPKILWLTKKSLMKSSIREFRKWWEDVTPIPVSGKPNQREFMVELALANNNPVVVNYDALNTTPILMSTVWDIIVMDEVHKLKGGANYNPTKVWENTAEVAKRAKFIMPLSGSPIQNHPKEMWAYLHMLDPIRFPDVNQFERQYLYGYGEGLSINWDTLIRVLSNRVIRKTMEDVGMELPDKIYDLREVELLPEQRRIYDQFKEQFFVWLDEQEENALTATSILAQLTRLRQIAIMPGSVVVTNKDGFQQAINCDESAKIDEAMDILEQVLAEGKQVAVFSSQFNAPLFEMKKRITEQFKVTCETLTGDNSNLSDVLEQEFEEGKIRVLCINMKSGSEGLNLQAGSHAIFLDLWWNPESNRQAEARLYRQGQKNNVVIHILQAENSVDQYIQAILDEKTEMITGIVESETFKKKDGWKAYLSDLI